MKSALLGAAVLTCLVIGISPAHARGPSPYLPLSLSPEMDRQIERVMLIAGKPVLKRPFAAADVLDALTAACRVDEVLCKSVRRYLDTYMNRYALTHASAEGAAAQSSTRALPNQHGMLNEDAWAVSAQALLQFSDFMLVQAGGLAYPGEASPTGTWV